MTSDPTAGGAVAEHPDYPRILAVFNDTTGPLWARDVCEAPGHELLPKNIEDTRAKLKRAVKLGILTEADTGSFARKQQPTPAALPQPHPEANVNSRTALLEPS